MAMSLLKGINVKWYDFLKTSYIQTSYVLHSCVTHQEV